MIRAMIAAVVAPLVILPAPPAPAQSSDPTDVVLIQDVQPAPEEERQVQPPPEEQRQDQPPPPELPETVVEGRPFPSNPLAEQTVVTPEASETAAGDSGSSVTVITQQDITATRATTVLEVLRGTVGLNVVQAGGPGGATSVFLRGANSEQTKVLLDGIPINDPSGAARGFDFSALTVDNIERIEVVRGPQSLLYGSDAIGGVIQIITKRGEGPLSKYAGGMGGSFGTRQERVGFSGGTQGYYYSFSAAYLDLDGFSRVARRFGGREIDGYQNATFSGRFGWTPREAFNLDYVFRYTDADAEIDDFLADNTIRENRLKEFFQRVQIQSLLLDGDIEQTFGFSLADYNRVDTDPGFVVPEFDGQTRQVDWRANLRLTENNVVSAGADYLQEEASSTVLPQTTQNLAGVYVQDRFNLGDFSFTSVGVRWDDHSTAGGANTYRFTQLFRVAATGTAFHGSIGTGFRAPAIAQRVGIVGNPALRPEVSKGWDAGVRQRVFCDQFEIDVTYFRNDFRDLIVFDPTLPGPAGLGALNNVDRARVTGLETSASWIVNEATSANFTYTYNNPINLTASSQLLRRPRNAASFSLHRQLLCEQASLNLYFVYTGPRIDFGTLGLTTLPGYSTVNLSGKYQLSKAWELYFRADNLFDASYEEVFGFTTPGISGYFGANVRW